MKIEEKISKLKTGNTLFHDTGQYSGDVSRAIRQKYSRGQRPFAVVLTCSDSRTIPEVIFSVGIGDLFVIRVAGNILGPSELASLEYALEVLGCDLVLVLGHRQCGAVAAAMDPGAGGHMNYVLDEIRQGIGLERDYEKAIFLNVDHSIKMIEEKIKTDKEYRIIGGVYCIETGLVDFL